MKKVQYIQLENADCFKREDGIIYHIETKAGIACQTNLLKQGFYLADRMVDVTIKLQRSSIDFSEKVKLNISKCDDFSVVHEMALTNFPLDSRFQVCNEKEINNGLILEQLQKATVLYLCYCKNELAGFAAVQEEKESGQAEIVLAAVETKFRLAGCAVSLYHGVAQIYKEFGYRVLTGTISCRNTAVMNLYSSLGATFSNPRDIYLEVPEN